MCMKVLMATTFLEVTHNTSYEMIDWANFTYNATNTTYSVGSDTLDAAPNSYTGNVIPHIRFAGTYVTFKPKTKSLKMSDLYNYQIKKVSQASIPFQHIKYSYVLPEVIEDGKPKEGTINIGEYLRTNDSVKVEITLDCEKDKTYYYKLDSSNSSSSIWADIIEINFESDE